VEQLVAVLQRFMVKKKTGAEAKKLK
jgi:hypothetical protein